MGRKWVKKAWTRGPFGVLKQVFLAHLEPLVMRLGP